MMVYRGCDVWHPMFPKEPQSPDFLQARFVLSLMEENIKCYISWRLHCLVLINFWYDERGTSQNLSSFYFHNCWIFVEVMTQNVNFHIWPVQYLACQKDQRMYKDALIVNKVHMVYRKLTLVSNFFRWVKLRQCQKLRGICVLASRSYLLSTSQCFLLISSVKLGPAWKVNFIESNISVEWSWWRVRSWEVLECYCVYLVSISAGVYTMLALYVSVWPKSHDTVTSESWCGWTIVGEYGGKWAMDSHREFSESNWEPAVTNSLSWLEIHFLETQLEA